MTLTLRVQLRILQLNTSSLGAKCRVQGHLSRSEAMTAPLILASSPQGTLGLDARRNLAPVNTGSSLHPAPQPKEGVGGEGYPPDSASLSHHRKHLLARASAQTFDEQSFGPLQPASASSSKQCKDPNRGERQRPTATGEQNATDKSTPTDRQGYRAPNYAPNGQQKRTPDPRAVVPCRALGTTRGRDTVCSSVPNK